MPNSGSRARQRRNRADRRQFLLMLLCETGACLVASSRRCPPHPLGWGAQVRSSRALASRAATATRTPSRRRPAQGRATTGMSPEKRYTSEIRWEPASGGAVSVTGAATLSAPGSWPTRWHACAAGRAIRLFEVLPAAASQGSAARPAAVRDRRHAVGPDATGGGLAAGPIGSLLGRGSAHPAPCGRCPAWGLGFAAPRTRDPVAVAAVRPITQTRRLMAIQRCGMPQRGGRHG